MTTVGSYEAKTHLPQLLERVARGEKILITKHGQAVAMLVPPPGEDQKLDAGQVIQAMKELRKGNVLGKDLTIRDLIDEGRRFCHGESGEGKGRQGQEKDAAPGVRAR